MRGTYYTHTHTPGVECGAEAPYSIERCVRRGRSVRLRDVRARAGEKTATAHGMLNVQRVQAAAADAACQTRETGSR